MRAAMAGSVCSRTRISRHDRHIKQTGASSRKTIGSTPREKMVSMYLRWYKHRQTTASSACTGMRCTLGYLDGPPPISNSCQVQHASMTQPGGSRAPRSRLSKADVERRAGVLSTDRP